MKRSPDNQINASFIDIRELNKLLVFFIAVVCLPHNYTSTRSNRQHSREIEDLVTMDINPSLQILGWYAKGTCFG